ncbi:TRAP transporter permease [Devosia elaeis]|uniref:TRAP transporter n=1 Tax=Devosia elaeis TaxID=1770058 RepID=A0A178HNE5_9HYPH|nr:TRAP transporter fused permease subunit [Devosia elaeis]OAM73524.1 TRAP transporter [Devosia elaeis]
MNIPALFSTLIIGYHLIMVGNVPASFGLFVPTRVHAAVSLTMACIVIFLTVRAWKNAHAAPKDDLDSIDVAASSRMPFYDWLLIGAVVLACGYIVFFRANFDRYAMFGALDMQGMILALLLGVALLEAVRRTSGIALPLIIMFFVAITIFQQFLPGVLYGVGYPPGRILYSAYVGEAGFFGQPLRVAVSIILVYILFGSVMQVTGAGQWVIDLAMALTGRSRGGPAKASVLASAMFGSISGSPSSNVATTGVFTIPLMKSVGYTPAFAGATEAVASTGGQILPPVMGAIAFVMADWIGVPYSQVVMAALLPAILYYLVIFASVHFQAHKQGVRTLSTSELPQAGKIFVEGWRFLLPIVCLLFFLFIVPYPPEIAGIFATLTAVAASFLTRNRSQWFTLGKLLTSCHQTVLRWVGIVAITAAVGLMVGSLELSGVGIKLSAFLLEVSNGNLVATLVLVGLASLFLGMGLDAIPAYLTLATLMAPALIQLGVPDIAAHLFVVYWGLASFFTPPMCLAVFVSLPLSGAKMWETGWEAVRLGIAAFLIPYAFVLEPALLMRGEVPEIVLAFTTAAIGSVGLAAAIRGYAATPLDPLSRMTLAAASIMLIAPGVILPIIGFAVGVIVVVGNYLLQRRRHSFPTGA